MVSEEIKKYEKFATEKSDEIDVLMSDTLQYIVKMKEMKANGFFKGDEAKAAMYNVIIFIA
jgi:hypothetical protein